MSNPPLGCLAIHLMSVSLDFKLLQAPSSWMFLFIFLTLTISFVPTKIMLFFSGPSFLDLDQASDTELSVEIPRVLFHPVTSRAWSLDDSLIHTLTSHSRQMRVRVKGDRSALREPPPRARGTVSGWWVVVEGVKSGSDVFTPPVESSSGAFHRVWSRHRPIFFSLVTTPQRGEEVSARSLSGRHLPRGPVIFGCVAVFSQIEMG